MSKEMDYLPQEAIILGSFEDACALAKILIENGNVVLIGKEENFWTINWLYSELSDRNNVIFWDRELYEYDLQSSRKEEC